ncbi:DNA gyrase subunit B [Streptomyces sp. NPDC088097]|uniref:DNA gyrase subunit B n=1 Tax=Streptomyces sp. NPDC088097 TaxID=3365823 RepID=UPI003811F9F4
MSDEVNEYSAGHIEILEGLEAMRRRPGMYVGSTGERGLHQMVFELADRPVNEALAGRAQSVEITLMSDGGVRVADDGPGIPVGAAGDGGEPALEALLTLTCIGVRPRARHIPVLSPIGVGPCVVNALSSRLTAEVRREGVRWVQTYARGAAVAPPTAAGTATGSGTTITFRPDAEIFGTAECSFAVLAERFRELAFLNRGLDVALTDERPRADVRSVRFRFPGGTRDFVTLLDARSGAPVHADVIGFEQEDPRMAGTVEVALRWYDSPQERIRGFANSLSTRDGGTQTAGFRDGVTDAINAYARRRQLLTATDPDLGIDRIGEGLMAIVSVKLDRPEFLDATRDVLGGTEVRDCVREVVRDHLGRWLESCPEQATAVLDRIIRNV